MPQFYTEISVALLALIPLIVVFAFQPEISKLLKRSQKEIESNITESFSPENKLDDMLIELRRFARDWNRRSPWKTGYRRLIESRQIWLYLDRVSEQAQRIQRKIKPLQSIAINASTLSNLSNVADRMVDLGLEIETTFQTIKLEKESLKADPNKIQKLILDGDKIFADLKPIISELEKLRKKL